MYIIRRDLARGDNAGNYLSPVRRIMDEKKRAAYVFMTKGAVSLRKLEIADGQEDSSLTLPINCLSSLTTLIEMNNNLEQVTLINVLLGRQILLLQRLEKLPNLKCLKITRDKKYDDIMLDFRNFVKWK